MCSLINVERQSKLPIALKLSTLVVAGQRFCAISFAVFRGTALHFLFLGLALTGDVYFILAWLVLFAREGGVTRMLDVWVAARLLWLTTRLLAWLPICVFALAGTMALSTACVNPASKLSAADLAASDISQPARLIFHSLLAAHTTLLHEERTLGARFVIQMAIVGDLRMTARLGSCAWIPARRRLGTAWQRRLQNSSSAVAAELVKDGLPARVACTLVA